MGNVSSRAEDSPALFLRDQNRLAITSIQITNSRNRLLYSISPNSFPASRLIVKRDVDDDSPVEYVQDPDISPTSLPGFLLRLHNDEDLIFYFTFAMRQAPAEDPFNTSASAAPVDTSINSLTFLFASSPRELDTLLTREFNADPNIHKHPNVDLVGDYSTNGNSIETFEWSWKWRPPKPDKDRGDGWKTSCSFVEYEPRTHKLQTLVTFSFWVNNNRIFGSPKTPAARLDLSVPPRYRIPSNQSVESRMSDSDTDVKEPQGPPSPAVGVILENAGLDLEPSATANPVKVDINFQKPGEDISAVEDGPVFRATIKALEQKTGNMRARMKQVLKRAEAARETQVACNRSVAAFMEALREASSSNANAVQPALDHYFEKIATEILAYEKQNAEHLQKLIIDPISKLYSNDIKQVDSKKKDFEDESREFYAYVGRYLGQRQDSLKEKKRVESDSKYQSKRRNFELKRFDYSSFMQDLHGGRKDQEVLSQLTKYANAQAQGYLATAKTVEAMMPQLEALCREVREADKEYQLLRTGREEKRRTLEKSSKPGEAEASNAYLTDSELTQSNGLTHSSSLSERPKTAAGPSSTNNASTLDPANSVSPRSQAGPFSVSPSQNKFKGIRDLEDRDSSSFAISEDRDASQRKEGLLWSLNRPASHVDAVGLNMNKQAWHKYWIVLDQGKLCEYVNWKDVLEQHREPIDLRLVSVREARNTERRFCFEVRTPPNGIRIYQAPSEDEMKAWILAINNAVQSAHEARGSGVPEKPSSSGGSSSSFARDLFGKSSSYHGHRSSSTSQSQNAGKNVSRYATVGDRPPLARSHSTEERISRLLQSLREADPSNTSCADCGTEHRVEWVSINLGIIICIECSGIHRSLGTHITKIRSLTLDTTSFTQDLVEVFLNVGNRKSNTVWEATLDRNAGTKAAPASTRDHRLQYITAKYSQKSFVTPLTPATSRFATADEMLIASIKRNDFQSVIHALALGANPNSTDRSRSTHAVFLALAAADPASPSMASTPPSTQADKQPVRKSFPLAELLLQNGADIPSSPPPIPLSHSSQIYIEFKRDQKLGRVPQNAGTGSGNGAGMTASPPEQGHVLPSDGNGDTITALPRFDGSGSGSINIRSGDRRR